VETEIDKEKYQKYERESILNCNDETKLWSGYVLQQSLINKFKRAGFIPEKIGKDGEHYFENIPFNCISIRSISTKKRKPMSEDHKQKLKDGREAKKG
jgi:hypothetical protein